MNQTQEQLFKYCSSANASQILSSKKLRWSAPNLFNDPLELDYLSRLNFDKTEVLPAAIKVASSMIFSREIPKGDTPLINAIKRWRDIERFQSPEEAEGILEELLGKMVDARFNYLDKLLALWRNYHQKLRLCCFCASATNIHAWQNNADRHRGVAICFTTGKHTSFNRCYPISYGNIRPEITDLREQLHTLIFNLKDKSPERFSETLLRKPAVFKNEQEWRCVTESPNTKIETDPSRWFDDIAYERGEVAAIHFGLAIDEANKKALTKLIRTDFSAAKIYQSRLAKGKYEIETVKC